MLKLALLCVAFNTLCAASVMGIELTEEERAFIYSREVVVGLSRVPWEPIDVPSAQGDYQGISADILRHVSRVSGLRYRIQYENSFLEVLEKLQWGSIDVAPSAVKTFGRSTFLQFTSPYYVMPTVFVTRRDTKDFSAQLPVTNLRIAVDKGAPNSELMSTIFPNATSVEFESIEHALKGVATKEADVYVGALTPTIHIAEKHLLSNLEIRGQRDLGFGELRFATAKGNKTLLSILEKALAELSPREQRAIVERWRPVSNTLGAIRTPLELSEYDTRYLQKLRKLRVAYLNGVEPFSSRGPTDRPEGIGNDYFRMIAQKLGIAADEFIATTTAELPKQITNREFDVILALRPTLDRERYLTFIGPILSMETAIINRASDEYILVPEQLAGKRVAVVSYSATAEKMRLRVPSATLVQVKTVDELFQRVSQKQADALVELLPIAAPKLSGAYAGSLKVSSTLSDESEEMAIGVRNDMPHFAQLVKRAYDDISEAEHFSLRNRWLTFETRTGVPWSTVLITIGAIAAILTSAFLVALRFNRKLSRATVARGELAERYARALVQAREAANSKTHLLSAVSNEVRSPLSAVIGVLDLLKTTELSDQNRRYVELAAGAARSQFELLGEILDYTNAEERTLRIDRKPVDISQLSINAVETFMAAANQKGLNLHCSVSPNLAGAHLADAKRLRQIISNLVNNAIKFTQQGEILVEVTVSDEANRQKVMWRIRDTGIGIAVTDQARLFQPFMQANENIHARYGGTGLGLALCKALATQMGGELMLDSAPGLGTEVRLMLTLDITTMPADDAQRGGDTGKSERQIATPLPNRPGTRIHVLLVESNASMNSALGELLQTLGCEVTASDNPVEAMKFWSARAFDLVITDLVLPGLDGRELVRAMRALEATDQSRTPTPIAVVTGDWSGDRREIDQELGVYTVLQSPVDLETLKRLLAKIDSLLPQKSVAA